MGVTFSHMKWDLVLPLWADLHLFHLSQNLKRVSSVDSIWVLKTSLTPGIFVFPVTNYLSCITLSKAFWNSKLMATPVVCTSHHSRNNFRNMLSVSFLCKFHPDAPGNVITITNSFLSPSIIKETSKVLWVLKKCQFHTMASASPLASILVWNDWGLFHLLSIKNILEEAPAGIYPKKSQNLQCNSVMNENHVKKCKMLHLTKRIKEETIGIG